MICWLVTIKIFWDKKCDNCQSEMGTNSSKESCYKELPAKPLLHQFPQGDGKVGEYS